MFWGHILKEGKPLQLDKVIEESDYSILHLSTVSLPKDVK
jgi:hypothetical protein